MSPENAGEHISEFEERLRGQLRRHPHPGQRGRIMASCRQSEPETAGYLRKLLIAGVAAAILVCTFFFFSSDSSTPRQPGQVAISLPEGIAPVRVLNIHQGPDSNRAILQDMNSFKAKLFAEGDSIADYTVKHITPLNVTLEKPGLDKGFVIDQNSHAGVWNEYTEILISQYSTQAGEGKLTAEQLECLHYCALAGHNGALDLLKDLSGSKFSALKSGADTALAGNLGLEQVYQLIDTAANGKQRYRIRALKRLAEIRSPLTNQYLRSALDREDDPLLPVVVRMISVSGDSLALGRLQELAHEAPSEQVRTAALDSIHKITQGE
ncbi:HEAT repeat domain-containing protein [Planctomycetota bacterium]